MSKRYRDYLGVWPDIGEIPPAAKKFPKVIGLSILGLDEVRYLEYTDLEDWVLPDEPPQPPTVAETSGFTEDEKVWGELNAPSALSEYIRLGRRDNPGLCGRLADVMGKLSGSWIHPLGDRITLESVHAYSIQSLGPGDYGERFRVKMRTADHELLWWTSGNCWIAEGWTGSVRCTIKAHGVWDGRRVTTVDRCADPTKPRTKRAKDDE